MKQYDAAMNDCHAKNLIVLVAIKAQRLRFRQWLKYKIGGGGSLSISGPLRDPADISQCIVDVNWVPDLSIVKFLGPGLQIRQDPAYVNHWV